MICEIGLLLARLVRFFIGAWHWFNTDVNKSLFHRSRYSEVEPSPASLAPKVSARIPGGVPEEITPGAYFAAKPSSVGINFSTP